MLPSLARTAIFLLGLGLTLTPLAGEQVPFTVAASRSVPVLPPHRVDPAAILGSARDAAPDHPPGSPRGHGRPLTADEVRSIGREAYVWGWPLVYLHHCRVALERVPAPGRSGGMPVAPLNRLSMLTDRISPKTTRVPCPNQDVIYGFGMFDLAADAVVVQVPHFGGRFWLYQLGDQRTDSFAEVGSIYGTLPGMYLVVGPEWRGTVPSGIAGVFRCPTRYAYCLPRVFFTDSAADREAALPAISGIVAYPLGEYTGESQQCDWSKPKWLPNLAARGGQTRGVVPETFFDVLPSVLDDVPPLPGEESLYERFRMALAAAAADPALAAVLREAAVETARDVVAPLTEFRNVGLRLPAHWTTVVNGAAFGTDYLTRTAVAVSNVFVNRHHETKYYFQDLDAHGQRLDGSREYRLTFPPGALPPSKGFWSLTLYDERHALPETAGGRASLGSRDADLVVEADGSLTIVVSRDGPAGDHTIVEGRRSGNRLTAPDGRFSLYLRLYWPETSALDGTWTPPAVQPVAGVSQRAGL